MIVRSMIVIPTVRYLDRLFACLFDKSIVLLFVRSMICISFVRLLFIRLIEVCSCVCSMRLFVCYLFIRSFVLWFVCRSGIRWFVGLLVCWFVGLLVCWFVGSSVCSSFPWFVGLLVHWFVLSIVRPFVRSSVRYFVCSMIVIPLLR